MIIVDKAQFLQMFAEEVGKDKFKKIEYKIWRRLVLEAFKYLIIEKEHLDDYYVSFKIFFAKKDPDTDDIIKNSFICSCNQEDDSLGSFLFQNWKNLKLSSDFTNSKRYINMHYNDNNLLIGDNYQYSSGDVYQYSSLNKRNDWRDISNSTCDATSVNYNPIHSNTTTTEKPKEDKKKEKEDMNTNKMFNFEFGPVSSNQFRMSPYGIAVNTAGNSWVSYNTKTGEVFDVDIVNFDVSKMIYKMPVALNAVKVGDIVIHSNRPMFVRALNQDGTVKVLDFANSAVMDIVPVKSPFGFNFVTKICALFNFNEVNASAENPFGNMLPFLMLGNTKEGDFDYSMFLMATMMTGKSDFANNPMMMFFMLNSMNNGKMDKDTMLPMMLMMNNGNMFNPQPTVVPTPASAG